jgi:hypothetical protein
LAFSPPIKAALIHGNEDPVCLDHFLGYAATQFQAMALNNGGSPPPVAFSMASQAFLSEVLGEETEKFHDESSWYD